MTSTDRAFIDAYRRSTPDETIETNPGKLGGPHFLRMPQQSPAPRRAPLSALMAERREKARTNSDAKLPSIVAFTWPEIPLQLAERHPRPLLEVLTTLGENVVMLVGARAGTGATTVSIALARTASNAGLRVAIVDGNPVASDLALAMGAGKIPTLAEAAEQGSLPEQVTATAKDERISIVVGGGPITAGSARRQLAALAEANDLVVVDAGAIDTGSHEPPTAWIRAANSVTVVAATGADLETSRSLRALDAARVAVNGVIENPSAA